MADKGFIVKDLLPLGVSLNLPPFLGASSQIAVEDVVKTQEIASLWYMLNLPLTKLRIFTSGTELFHYIKWGL